ncbi:MAG: hypothetical protein CMM48_16425 [Rhodospirillaceae bacterium]|nr:hypothetical protein [Rhodospirillaceae bacterium]
MVPRWGQAMPRKVHGKTGNTYFKDNVEIFGGKGHVHKIPTSKNWYFRTWIDEEKRHLRQSLRTTDLDEATQKAEKLLVEILADVSKGKKFFGITVEQVAKEFLDAELERVETGLIKKGRWNTVKTQINRHLVRYLGPKTKLGQLDHNSFYDYAQWRRKNTSSVTETTIRNEHATIGSFLKFALRRGYINFPYEMVEFEEIKIKEKPRRDTFELEEYDYLTRYVLPSWVKTESKRSNSNMMAEMRKQFIRDMFLVMANTGVRPSEVWQLTWGMVSIKDYDKKSKQTLVELDLPASITKTARARKILCRGGQYFKRIRTYSNWLGDDDLIFVNNSDGTPISKSEKHRLWHEFMEFAEESGRFKLGDRKITYYSLRHWAITCRLYANVNIFDVSQWAGTSVQFIQDHYGHVDQSKQKVNALKSFTVDEHGYVEASV